MSRTERDEMLTRFAYYAQVAANLFPEKNAALLQANGYDHPAEVMRELAQWLYDQRTNP